MDYYAYAPKGSDYFGVDHIPVVVTINVSDTAEEITMVYTDDVEEVLDRAREHGSSSERRLLYPGEGYEPRGYLYPHALTFDDFLEGSGPGAESKPYWIPEVGALDSLLRGVVQGGLERAYANRRWSVYDSPEHRDDPDHHPSLVLPRHEGMATLVFEDTYSDLYNTQDDWLNVVDFVKKKFKAYGTPIPYLIMLWNRVGALMEEEGVLVGRERVSGREKGPHADLYERSWQVMSATCDKVASLLLVGAWAYKASTGDAIDREVLRLMTLEIVNRWFRKNSGWASHWDDITTWSCGNNICWFPVVFSKRAWDTLDVVANDDLPPFDCRGFKSPAPDTFEKYRH